MSKEESSYDLVIVGAGITGVGIAIAASQQGLKTLLVDFNPQVAEATSDNSLRIIHGGFRYLQTLNLPRTIKSIKAQQELVETYPELVQPLRCLLPLDFFGLKSKYPAIIATKIFGVLQDLFSSSLAKPLVVSEDQANNYLPFFTKRFKNSALVWYDAQMRDPRELVNQELAQLSEYVSLALQTKIVQITKFANSFSLVDGQGNKFNSKYVVNAAAQGGQAIKKIDLPNIENQIFWGKAFNLVFKDNRNLQNAFAIPSAEGRQYFIVPRAEEMIAIGTFTAKIDEDLNPQVIAQQILEFNQACPEFTVKQDDLVLIEEGVLPAKREFHQDSDFLAKDQIFGDQGYLEVFTAKYTTYRPFGRDVLQQLLKSAK